MNSVFLPAETKPGNQLRDNQSRLKRILKYPVLFILFFGPRIIHAQAPVANFSANRTSGCAPLSVTFQDLSTGDPKFWNWDLGNGQLSNVQNPSTSYSPGTYTVKLVVRNSNGTNGITKTNYITVFPSPQANFVADNPLACIPATIQFTDLSIDTVGTITQWSWDFGDGVTSSQRNPQHSYNTVGFFNIFLTITSSTGCSNTIGRYRYVRIVPGVTPDFNFSSDSACKPPFNIKFNNQTSGPGTITYNWNFGNGSSSTATNPTATYSATGTYSIVLNATSQYGCSGTVTKPVTLNPAITNFNSPDSACQNKPVNFMNASNPSPVNSRWNFGDGTTSTTINPTKTYPIAGTYSVHLYNSYSYCADSAIKQIKILGPPTTNFTSNVQNACKGPFTVTFQDLSPNAIGWQWNFGDGSTSTQQNPTHTYQNYGVYDVTLTITSSFSCVNTITKTGFIKIVKPVIAINNVPAGGCIPYTASPVASVTSIDGVSSYFWDFGDGSTGAGQNPTHTYINSGTYNVKLVITTTSGCRDSLVVPGAVRTGTPPFVDFSVSSTSGCASNAISFTDLSNPSDAWLWDFGDGTTSSIQNPMHTFTDTGFFTISLTAYNNGCGKTTTKLQLIHIIPPIADFDYNIQCTNKFNVTFNNKSKVDPTYGPVSYFWQFGDPGNNTSTAANPVFSYSLLGTYNVTLTVTNGSCTNTTTIPAKLIAEAADFSASKTNPCKNEIITISAINSNPGNVAKYQWSINGGPLFDGQRSFQTSFPNNGSNSILLTITDNNGCHDTLQKNNYINVTGPSAAFASAPPGGCKNTVITFNDLSTPAGTIRQWTWNFGDGQSQSFTSSPFTHKYADTGLFNVQLIVKDLQGCTDTTTKDSLVRITRPKADFYAINTLFCAGGSLQFRDSSQQYITGYSWNFGDGGTSNLKDPTHTYTGTDSLYSVKLIVTDTVGCTDTTTKVNYIQIKSPKPSFVIKDTSSICPPLQTTFSLQAQDYTSFLWDFGDGQTSTLANPNHFYNSYGNFAAKLYVTGYGGCVDSATKTVHVYNPNSTTINYSPLQACNELNVNFDITPPPGTRYYFFFGDGVIDSTQRISFQHLYNLPSYYSPYIMIKDTFDCQVSVGGPNLIRIYGAEPIFGVDKKAFCDTGTVYFTNYTIANDPVVTSVWDFGDGTTSTVKDPIHSFNIPGTYSVSLTVTTQQGCVKSLYDTVKIYRTPVPTINSPDVVCLNAPIDFTGTLSAPDTSIKWSWSLGNGQNSAQQHTITIYTTVGNPRITLEATNYLGCKNNTRKDISVVPLPQVNIFSDPVILSGTGTIIPSTYSQNIISYNWIPAIHLSCTDCPNPYANPQFTTKYRVAVVDSSGCVNARDITVTVVCNDKNYFIPNTFSPNGDGINDVFYPRGLGINRIRAMRIFNRWGELVFEKRDFLANDPSAGWDGTIKGRPAQQDAYIFVIEFICENAAIVPYKGNVTLIR